MGGGPGAPEIDSDEKYLSVDIGIVKEDRDNLSAHICEAILGSLPIISAAVSHRGISGLDIEALRGHLTLLCERYTDSQS